jgi:two-component system sensor histidine kinase BaeS
VSPTPTAAGSESPGRRRRTLDTVASRTILVGVLAAAVAALVAAAIAVPLIRMAAQEQARSALSTLADTTAATLENPAPGSIDRLQQLLAERDTRAWLLVQGQPVPPGVPAGIADAALSGQPLSEQVPTADGALFLEARPVGNGAAVLLVTTDTAAEQAQQRTERRLGLSLLVGVAVAVGVAIIVSRRVTRPLREAAAAAERLASGDRDVRVDPVGPDEVVELAEQMNRLTVALAASEGRQRDFLLSVSHELRTPLTAITGYAEALADDVVPADQVQPTGEVLQREARRLTQLVADLLDLSRLGAADLRIDERPTDLVALLTEAGQVWRDRCDRVGVEHRTELPGGPLVVRTDALRVRQIVDNLAENALRVTPEGGTIVFALRHGRHDAELEVRDTGPGLAPEDLAVAFEPAVLYTRYAGVRPVGSGVGLALVGRLAARLGGRATAEQAVGGGARFVVSLPLDAPSPLTPGPVPPAASGPGGQG